MDEIDFDAWCNLAERRPDLYFRERERLIDRFIGQFPPDQAERLREFQLQIDHARAEAGSPLRATRRMMGMMEDQLEALHARLLCLQSETDRLTTIIRKARDASA
ncbi:MAG: DUF3135 domain-containing protein [Rhodocyclaceae bacterium]|nr:DUF3135 domain-containing protein [Rhodocyclaceae bacterium]